MSRPPSRSWITRAVVGIVLATFFSDFSHEMATAVLPLYLTTVGLGPAALGVIEGLADFLSSLSKLLGGVVGHHVRDKRPWASAGYLVTACATAGLGLVGSLGGLAALRSVAWFGRGFRSPLRDHMLADAVEPTHFGRAYGFERAGDMLGAVVGPLTAGLLVYLGASIRPLILWTLLPGLLAAGAMYFIGRVRVLAVETGTASPSARPRFPRKFWVFLVGVLLFGLGDFSRTFLIWLAAGGSDGIRAGGGLSVAVLLYALHNLVAAGVAFPVGHLGDRRSKLGVLVGGYGLGVVTNVLLAVSGGSLALIVVAIVLSGVYISVEETLEKAVAAEILPRESRSLGFGILASANAIGDMLSSIGVGLLLARGHQPLAFGLAAGVGLAGVGWMLVALRRWNHTGAATA